MTDNLLSDLILDRGGELRIGEPPVSTGGEVRVARVQLAPSFAHRSARPTGTEEAIDDPR